MNTDVRPEPKRIPFDPTARHLGVVVGYDGSENAEAAVHYAADVAARRGTSLTVVSAYRTPIPMYANPAALQAWKEDKAHQQAAESLLEKAAGLLSEHPGKVEYVTVDGDSVGALVEVSAKAQMIVIGSRGRGGFLGLLRGSVATSLPAHATCPTVVVPSRPLPDLSAPVVVGADMSAHSQVAVLQAAQVAKDRGAPLSVVMALPRFDRGGTWYPEPLHEADRRTELRRQELQEVLEADIRWLVKQVPQVDASGEVRIGEPARVLRDAASGAQLTVVGSRGRGAVASTLLGSTSREVLHEVDGPVMVVPYLDDDRVDAEEEVTAASDES